MLTYAREDRDGTPLYEYLYRCIRADILAGKLSAGERLPSRRRLAEHLRLSVMTVEGAYRQLEAEGWIVTVPGKGCFVCKTDHSQEERERLLIAFDETCSALYRVGVTAVELVKRLETGGK